MINGWKYYNYAMVPKCAAHELPDLEPVKSGKIFKKNKAILARWTTDYDCKNETSFWYVVLDHPFDLSKLKSKRRYEINKGIKNYRVEKINAKENNEDIFEVWKKSLEGYSVSYRPDVEYASFIQWINSLDDHDFYAAFNLKSGKMEGIALLSKGEKSRYFSALKVIPSAEKLGINAALVYGLVTDNEELLTGGGYICDGARNVFHKTNFQDYLEKYFMFRKAYCKLNICYRPGLKPFIAFAYIFKGVFNRFDNHPFFHKVNAVLKMEELRRG